MSQKDPIFATIFGENWANMPKVFHKHYANRGYSEDVTIVEGLMDVYIAPILRPFGWVLALTRTLVPINAQNIPVIVRFLSEPNSNAFWFDRVFKPKGKSSIGFKSRLMPIGDNRVIEYTKSGLAWKAAYEFVDNRVVLHHHGYVLRIFGLNLHLPLDWLFGQSTAFEEAIDDNSFRMYMQIKHWLFGKLYSYEGVFNIVKVP